MGLSKRLLRQRPDEKLSTEEQLLQVTAVAIDVVLEDEQEDDNCIPCSNPTTLVEDTSLDK